MRIFPQDVASTARTSLLASILVSLIFWQFPFETSAATAEMMFGGKLTFVSILLAAGTFQYRYFYEELFLKMKRELFPWLEGWSALAQSIDKAQEVALEAEKAMIRVRPIKTEEILQWFLSERQKLKDAEKYRQELAPKLQSDYGHFLTALSLQFGVGSGLLVSLFADFLYFTVSKQPLFLAFSFGGFGVALLTFTGLIVYYARAVRRQLDAAQSDIKMFASTPLTPPVSKSEKPS